MTANKVYKILTQDQWNVLETTGSFKGAPIDIQDGYIHLSTSVQVERVKNKYFADIRPLYIVEFSDEEMFARLKWEKASNGDDFPHLYGESLQKSLVTNVEKID